MGRAGNSPFFISKRKGLHLMAKEFMAEIEALCLNMGFLFGDWGFDLNLDMGRKHYDSDLPISALDLSSGNSSKLSMFSAIKMGDEKAAMMESFIADYRESRSKLIEAMGIKVPQIGKRWEVGKDEDDSYFVVTDGDCNVSEFSFDSRNEAEGYAKILAENYAIRFDLTAVYKHHPETMKLCWMVE